MAKLKNRHKHKGFRFSVYPVLYIYRVSFCRFVILGPVSMLCVIGRFFVEHTLILMQENDTEQLMASSVIVWVGPS